MKPSTVTLTKELFDNVYKRNKDGFGIMFKDPDTDTVISKKIIPNSSEDCWNLFQPYKDINNIILHWRFKTSGQINTDNAHPHEIIKDHCYLVHNGTFQGYGGNAESDTIEVNNTILKPIFELAKNDYTLFEKEPYITLLNNILVKSGQNKVIIKTPQRSIILGNFQICDDNYIPELKGLLYSNTYAWDNQFYYKTSKRNSANSSYESLKENEYETEIRPQSTIITYGDYRINPYKKKWKNSQQQINPTPNTFTNTTTKNKLKLKIIHLPK